MSTHTKSASLLKELISRGRTLGVAESCTGGAISAALTSISGASAIFLGGIIAYSPLAKEKILGISPKILSVYGLVSEEVAGEMALGVFKALSTDYSIATTGVAGPSGGTENTPVGTVCLAVARKGERPRMRKLHFQGTRMEIITQAVDEALSWLLQFIEEER